MTRGQYSFNTVLNAAIEIGTMIRGEQLVRTTVTELIRENHPDVRIDPDGTNGFPWDYHWSVPIVSGVWIHGTHVAFTVGNTSMETSDLTWTGTVPAIEVLERMADDLRENVALMDEEKS